MSPTGGGRLSLCRSTLPQANVRKMLEEGVLLLLRRQSCLCVLARLVRCAARSRSLVFALVWRSLTLSSFPALPRSWSPGLSGQSLFRLRPSRSRRCRIRTPPRFDHKEIRCVSVKIETPVNLRIPQQEGQRTLSRAIRSVPRHGRATRDGLATLRGRARVKRARCEGAGLCP